MSVQNLRNKFSQNNGSVPYKPPGLSYAKPSAQTLNNNNNNIMNGQHNGFGRFKTIREEPDIENRPAIKNNSFLQNYLAGETTKSNPPTNMVNGMTNIPVVSRYVSKPSTESFPKLPAKSPVLESNSTSSTSCLAAPLKDYNNDFKLLANKSPPPSIPADGGKHTISNLTSKYIIKPPPPPIPTDVMSKYGIKSPPPAKTDFSPKSNGVGHLASPGNDDRWKAKYEETEAKRKNLLTQSQKLLREKSDGERQIAKISTELESTKNELTQRTAQLDQLRKLSEGVYKEYDQLKQQYEIETGQLNKAIERASQWYKQNRELKRRSSALMQKVMSVAPATLEDLEDDTDGNDDTEFEELRKTVKELTQEVSRLQAELNKIKLQEFEAQEQTVDLTSELEEERRARKRAEQELKELSMKHNNLESVSRKVVEETTDLHERYKREKEQGVKIRNDANKVKSERDVLARQSQLLMMDAASDEKIMKLLFEVEQLQRTLSQERQDHNEQLRELQEKLECQTESEQIELYEEKLKLTEAELMCSQQRAEIAESQIADLRKKLECAKPAVAAPPCAPPPPPPPPMFLPPVPPPPPMALTSNSLQTIKLKTASTLNHTNNSGGGGDSDAIQEMSNYLGLPITPKPAQVQSGAIDAIVNQIKGGRFTLKATDKEVKTAVRKQEPPVVNEMMNVLGTLRRNPKRRDSFKTAPADVAL
ncbi:shootin-1-like [Adelges cooleyi]|uniref:shootin-1-like n=1 Tax=Adelges cooleyi TaxID=133065 RepID=UPI00217F7225|nr:shootin-1-like [Adelges cooleyi]XP_050435806.1 shootin-1-like [Adelges cooleyi]